MWFCSRICYRLNLKSGNVKRICNFSIPTAPTTSVPWTTWSPWTSPSAQASCNFDYGLCYGWSQSRSDIFDWTMRNGSTPSFDTGPSSDHTTGNGKYDNTVNDFTICASYQYTRPSSPVVQKLENTIKWINLYQMVNAISFPKSYPLDRDLPGGWCCPTFEQPGVFYHQPSKKQININRQKKFKVF